MLSSVHLSPLETAYLADGVPRAVGAALAGLAHMGLIEVRSDRTVVALKPPPTSLQDPIQELVVRCVSGLARSRSVEDIRKYAEPATQPVRNALRASGLLRSEQDLLTGALAIAGGLMTACILLLSLPSLTTGRISGTQCFGDLSSRSSRPTTSSNADAAPHVATRS